MAAMSLLDNLAGILELHPTLTSRWVQVTADGSHSGTSLQWTLRNFDINHVLLSGAGMGMGMGMDMVMASLSPTERDGSVGVSARVGKTETAGRH